MYRLKLFICNLSIPGKCRLMLIDLFASDGFSATVWMFIRFSQGAIAGGLKQWGETFPTPHLGKSRTLFQSP